MNSPEQQDTEKQMAVVRGGKNVPVTTTEGQGKFVFVRKLPFMEADKLAPAWGHVRAEIAIYCPTLTDEQLEELTPESQVAIYKEGRDLNFFTYKAYVAEQERTNSVFGEKTQELVKQLAQDLLRPRLPANGSGSSAPASPSQT